MDESIEAMNARLDALPDHALGFGFLEGQPKQRLVQVPRTPFSAYSSDEWTVDKIDDTSSEEGKVSLSAMIKLNPSAPLKKVVTTVDVKVQGAKAKTVLVFAFRRAVAMRSISIPSFQDLEPVRSNQHLSGGRWLVELYGNCVCDEEYYGGEAMFVLEWDRESGLTTADIEAKVKGVASSGQGQVHITKEFEKLHMRAGASVKGFSLPRDAAIDRFTVAGVMELVALLPRLPITTVAPVSTKTVGLHCVSGFPRGITVETKIRDVEVLGKLTEKLQAFAETAQTDKNPYLLVQDLREAIEDASVNDRNLLPPLVELAKSIVSTLSDHGRCYELYEREKVRRLHKAKCEEVSLASKVVDRLLFLPFPFQIGLGWVPVLRHKQASEFDHAAEFKLPEHYRSSEYYRETAALSYFDQVKVRLLFDDDALVHEWRGRLDTIGRGLTTSSSN